MGIELPLKGEAEVRALPTELRGMHGESLYYLYVIPPVIHQSTGSHLLFSKLFWAKYLDSHIVILDLRGCVRPNCDSRQFFPLLFTLLSRAPSPHMSLALKRLLQGLTHIKKKWFIFINLFFPTCKHCYYKHFTFSDLII